MAATPAPLASIYSVEFTVKVSYDTKHHAKELKCRWSPEDKKWKRSFTNTGQYGYRTAEKMYYAIASFIEECRERDVDVEYDELDYEELKDYMKAVKAHMQTFCTFVPLKEVEPPKVAKVEPPKVEPPKVEPPKGVGCIECKRSIDPQYVRCFHCHGIYWRDVQDGKRNVDGWTTKCLITDD